MGFLGISLFFPAVIVMAFLSSTQAIVFHVGGKQGWVSEPSEDYNRWAERNRFQVNDTLLFKYKKGQNSVLVVTRENYYKCNIQNPIKNYTDGDTEFKFDHSGAFFFISGNVDYCQKSQRLIVVVLAVRNWTHPAPPPAAGHPPLPSPPKESPTGSPSPSTESPTGSPSPSTVSPTGSPSPSTESPEGSPSSPTVSPSPSSSSSPAPSSEGGQLSPAPAPGPHGAAPGLTASLVLVLGLSFGVSVIWGNSVGLQL